MFYLLTLILKTRNQSHTTKLSRSAEEREVYYNGRTGHVSSKYLSQSASQYSDRRPNENSYTNYESKDSYKLIQKTSLRLRPDSQANSLLRFSAGDKVDVINSSGDWWWEVIYNGERGWVKKRLLVKN